MPSQLDLPRSSLIKTRINSKYLTQLKAIITKIPLLTIKGLMKWDTRKVKEKSRIFFGASPK